ncbi:hypothetical protein AA0521_1065 [Komagataeibacter intermedius NRIC 0521]|uniref:Uncharacterized protein n=1 Tax=Komagataeibacter intermedius NRIC 0521 TaxID=1307934 RepID=A0ABQ0PHB8_9PROT|nr:hypothetical protein AA0521_1065 [Komagataeibacter intermedius NRIC 0521]
MDAHLVGLFKGAKQFGILVVAPCQHIQHVIGRPDRGGLDGGKDDEGGRGGKGAATAACGHKGQLLQGWEGNMDGYATRVQSGWTMGGADGPHGMHVVSMHP